MTAIIPIRALRDNYIWMIHNTTGTWVVDPGDATPVIDVLKRESRNLTGILLTHHHNDHSGGIAQLIEYAGTIPVYASHLSPITLVTHRLKENDVVDCGELRLTALEIPGHTLDHMAYTGDSSLFSGDTLFSAGCGRIFEGTPPQMYSSLEKLVQLPDNTRVYCGHEYTLANLKFAQAVEPTNRFITDRIELTKAIVESGNCTLPSLIKDEKKINPFLRCHHVDVIAAVEKYSGEKYSDPVNTFKLLREWKNTF